MDNAQHENGLSRVVDFKENPLVADSHAPAVGGAAQLDNTGRPRLLFEGKEGLCDA